MKGFVQGTYLGLPHTSVTFYTTDGGGIWNYFDPGTDKSLSGVFFIDNNHGWAAGLLGAIICTTIFTGINSFENDVFLLVYPNPATNNISIFISSFQEERVTISIINSIGQTVYSSIEEPDARTAIQNINTSRFSEGIYTAILKGSSEVASQKIIIRR